MQREGGNCHSRLWTGDALLESRGSLQRGLSGRSGSVSSHQEDVWDVYKGLANVGSHYPYWLVSGLSDSASRTARHGPHTNSPHCSAPLPGTSSDLASLSASLDSAPHNYWALGHEFHLSLITSS